MFPQDLQAIIGNATWDKDTLGMSEASAFKLTGVRNGRMPS
jgi:hypothetical protein